MSDNFSAKEANSYSPLSLAYLGDAVFELRVRLAIMQKGNMPVNKLHRLALSYVKAQAQAQMYHKLLEHLTVEEMSVLKRGRNAKSHTTAKNASVNDYRHATAVETLFGYLFLKGEELRIDELFAICMDYEGDYE